MGRELGEKQGFGEEDRAPGGLSTQLPSKTFQDHQRLLISHCPEGRDAVSCKGGWEIRLCGRARCHFQHCGDSVRKDDGEVGILHVAAPVILGTGIPWQCTYF